MIELIDFERYSDSHDEIPTEPIKCKAKNYQSVTGDIDEILGENPDLVVIE